ncbi:DUF2628 domain-containing protein [Neobacillus sp. DY30]|uniref:DUF2628 domain-containing protein n=1 Tax=Neobacillus sp. DY30 TaxID=3047871 RepID=UPI0024BF9E3A|nr:DUF2628 domain-containing protein [Neobacillus sp. DY30]WHY00358.1 DUF2628 domain-containing protein [Neobacillus sp. DY30]
MNFFIEYNQGKTFLHSSIYKREVMNLSCRDCGQEIGEHEAHCYRCGHVVSSEYVQDPKPAQELVENDLEMEQSYVGKKHHYYRRKWDQLENRAIKTSWNWASFFLGPIWLGYRKMYRYLGFLAGIYLWLDLLLYFIDITYSIFYFPILWVLKVCITLLYGLFGNYFYLQHTKRQLTKGKRRNNNQEKMDIWSKKKGRTNWITAITSFMGFVIFYLVSQDVLIPPNAINIVSVQNGSYKSYPSATIGNGFHRFFGSPHWENQETELPYEIVRFTGVADRDGEVVSVIIDIGITGDSYIDQMIVVDGEVLDQFEREHLLGTIFAD